ncbi:hypothetical protein [Cellulosimicrobium sp. TH-20]|uniref:hypothetical protein n=1 Tax=Cellulosimicrobium sp. TH-20 TaxID=1980001 RepID=UPI001C92ED32|nr:hypothetical protein [Cellulosimicrobium sp. TH-20]
MNPTPGPAPHRPVPPGPLRPTLGETVRSLSWPLVLGLGALALVRPLLSVTGLDDAIGRPAAPLLATLVLTILWVGAIVVARPAHPLATGVAVGLAYGVLALILSALLSPILTGELQGPVAHPVAIVPMLLTNAAWGAFAGAMALGLLAARRR